MATPSSPTSEPARQQFPQKSARQQHGTPKPPAAREMLHQQQESDFSNKIRHGNVVRSIGSIPATPPADWEMLHPQQNNNNIRHGKVVRAIGAIPATPPADWKVLHQQQKNNNTSGTMHGSQEAASWTRAVSRILIKPHSDKK
ncbi:uncharacterized protein LOC129743828 [Uranotaenia lowii]|uniref:uncharacterized protein LOC129743828 n=1 Tax=Uranotaenia lowii TaxID=190385 RepID=UPI00247B067C|nr:uncharacterized protein LOC129743828 [Uranotaenia lowii]